jgi:hypothetical protein
MKPQNKPLIRLAVHCIVEFFGSFAEYTGKAFRTREQEVALPYEHRVRVIGFDARGVTHTWHLPTVDQPLADVNLESGEKIPGNIPDLQSRKIAEARGKLYMQTAIWVTNPGLAGHNDGVAGNICAGNALASLNDIPYAEKFSGHISSILDYENQNAAGVNSDVKPTIDIIEVASICGGTGAGAFARFNHVKVRQAKLCGANIRVFPIIVLRGTLNPADGATARRNEQLSLRSLLANYEGQAWPMNMKPDEMGYFCEAPIFITNANEFGQLNTAMQLQTMIFKLVWLLAYSPAGKKFRQEVLNLHQEPTLDQLGRLRKGATAGIAAIHCNNDKIQTYTAARLAQLTIGEILKEYSNPEPVEHAMADARQYAIIDKTCDDTALKRLFEIHSGGKFNAQDRAMAIFRSRSNYGLLLERCQNMKDSLRHVIGIEVAKNLKTAITHNADSLLQESTKAITVRKISYLAGLHGLHTSRIYLKQLLSIAELSMTSNQAKIKMLYTANTALKSAISHYDNRIDTFEKKSWFIRLFYLLAIYLITKCYPVTAEMLIHNELEIIGRKILAGYLERMVDYLKSELVNLDRIGIKIVDYSNEITDEVQRLNNLANDYYVPVGIELASENFMGRVCTQVLEKTGGTAKAIDDVFLAVFEKTNIMDAFTHNFSILKAKLTDVTAGIARPNVSNLKVFDVFQTVYPTPELQREQIFQRVRESSGRLILNGLGNQKVPCLKYIICPDQTSADFVTSVANESDRSGGDWVSVIDPTVNEITFFKYISCISIPSLIEDTYTEVGPIKDRKKLVRIGDDPVIMLAPFYDGTWTDIDRTIAQAICMNSLQLKRGEYMLHADGVAATLGTDLATIRECLKSNLPLATRIHMEFAGMLAQRQEEFLEEILQLQSQQRVPKVAGLPREALKDAYEIACLLLPHVRRSNYGNA